MISRFSKVFRSFASGYSFQQYYIELGIEAYYLEGKHITKLLRAIQDNDASQEPFSLTVSVEVVAAETAETQDTLCLFGFCHGLVYDG